MNLSCRTIKTNLSTLFVLLSFNRAEYIFVLIGTIFKQSKNQTKLVFICSSYNEQNCGFS